MKARLKVCLAWLWPRLKKYGWNMLIATDQWANSFFFGHPDETFSARAHRKAEAGQWFWRALRWVINHIFFWQDNHCHLSYESELARSHSPRESANG